MIRVHLRHVSPDKLTYGLDDQPRDIDADDVGLYESGWATFYKMVPVEGEKFKDNMFVEAIRLEKIDSIVRIEP